MITVARRTFHTVSISDTVSSRMEDFRRLVVIATPFGVAIGVAINLFR